MSVPHTTTTIVINENDSKLLEDIISRLSELDPMKGKHKQNGEGNVYAHILNTLVGSGISVPIENNRSALGN